MIPDVQLISAAVVQIIAPFMPYLLKAAKIGGIKVIEAIGEKGGEAAWNKAQDLWGNITRKYHGDDEINAIANLISTRPDQISYWDNLTEILAEKLKADSQLLQELLSLMGGEKGIQQITAENSYIERVTMKMSGVSGKQGISSSYSDLTNIKMEMD
jgi:hypothetical protein